MIRKTHKLIIKIKKRIQEVLLLKSIFKELSRYLRNGRYSYKNGALKPIKKFQLIPFRVFENKDKKGDYSECKIFFGGWSKKIVVIFDDIVLSFYKHKNYSLWFDNIQKYLPECTYPKCKYLLFDYTQKYNICSREPGKNIKDDQLVFEMAKKILSDNSQAKKYNDYGYSADKMELLENIGLKNIISYVQHGDLTRSNIFKNGEDYSLIDFDTINVKPALYDFFRLLLDTKEGFINYINGYFDKELMQLFSDEENKMEIEEIKDKYLACFYVVAGWDKSKISGIVPEDYFYTNKIMDLLHK